jgi:hypothetical protein
MATKKKLLQAAAGTAAAGGGAGGLNVEDVFSTYLYEGNGSTQTITNGIDLDAEGGLVWVKQRSSTNSNTLHDTERGANSALFSNNTSAENTQTNRLTAFNSDGFTLGDNGGENTSGEDYASWTFRKAPKFFDVVEFTNTTGNDVDISHNLGAVPAMIIGKRTDASDNWMVWHVGTGMSNGGFTGLSLNNTASAFFTSVQSDQGINSTTFNTGYVLSHDGSGNYTKANVNGASYVFYLFAHNDGDGEFGPDGDADIIKCGSFTTNSSGNATVDLGFEPQFVILKFANQGSSSVTASSWLMLDNMRGFTSDGTSTVKLEANSTNPDDSVSQYSLTNTGFNFTFNNSAVGGADYIYIAIRRGPMGIPESASDVFGMSYAEDSINGTFPVDAVITKVTASASDHFVRDRLRGGKYLSANRTNAETTNTAILFDDMTGLNSSGWGTDYIHWLWKRAPSFFDVVAYTGNGTAGRTVSHNLGVAPEMMWVKRRNSATDWRVYHKDIGNTHNLQLNLTAAKEDDLYWNDTTPTDSVFTLNGFGDVNGPGYPYIAYLFASLDGVSKVGSYIGSASDQTIDCGFTNGARLVLIKSYQGGSGNWFLFDTERGIVAGNDPELSLNNTDAEGDSPNDYIDPHSSGFTLVGNKTTNKSGFNFIFYAIA